MADQPSNNQPTTPPTENKPQPATPAAKPAEGSVTQTAATPAVDSAMQKTAEAPAQTKQAEAPAPAEAAPQTPASEPAPQQDSQTSPEELAAAETPPQPPGKNLSKKMILILGAVGVVVLSIIIALALSAGGEKKTAVTNTTETEIAKPTFPKEENEEEIVVDNPNSLSRMLVYGSWSGQTSLIKAVELSSNTTKLLASLPSSIKKVSVTSSNTILYIDETDKRDHGRKIVIYDIKTKSPKASILASPGYGIDDYVLSPDKKYIAIWEVSFASNMNVLLNGKSRVYAVNLARPTVKKLLYDETSTPGVPIHYPRAVLNNGRVFTDKFMPNDTKGGVGWAYGLSVIDFDGTNRQDIPHVLEGSYGTQPSLSPDGQYLVFSGYDGSRGDGKAVVNGYRQALLTPNTVELLDTKTLTRQRLPNLDNKNVYASSEWDPATGRILLTVLSPDADKTGMYYYDLVERKLGKINIPTTGPATYSYLTQITDGISIIGAKDGNESNMGNLGDNYDFPYTQLAIMDNASAKVSFVQLEDTFAQYITVLPGNYFNSVLGLTAHAQELPKPTFVDLFSSQNTQGKNRQQLYTFVIKYDLASTRQLQQSQPLQELDLPPDFVLPSGFKFPTEIKKASSDAPKCKSMAIAQCEAQGLSAGSGEFTQCRAMTQVNNRLAGKCSDSPLYLYGPEGLTVDVQIQTPISNAIPAYDNGYKVTLREGGAMEIGGKSYKSIAYDYKANLRKISPPKNGMIVTKKDAASVLHFYATKLGLNEKETADLMIAGQAKITSPYAFISFFDHETSSNILPISFTPQPDNYRNVVFYFKNLEDRPLYTPLPPVFPEPIKRTGFTAIEVSEMVE